MIDEGVGTSGFDGCSKRGAHKALHRFGSMSSQVENLMRTNETEVFQPRPLGYSALRQEQTAEAIRVLQIYLIHSRHHFMYTTPASLGIMIVSHSQ